MKRIFMAVLLAGLAGNCMGRDIISIEVKAAVSAGNHVDQGAGALFSKMMIGKDTRVESYNLQAVIEGQNVMLVCDDPRGVCESLAPGPYQGAMGGRGHVKLTFSLPFSHKNTSRFYKIAGTW